MILRIYDFLSAEKPKFSQNLIAVIADVISLKTTRRAYDLGTFELTVPQSADGAAELKPDRIIVYGDGFVRIPIADTTRYQITDKALYITDVSVSDKVVTVSGYDLKYILAQRLTLFPTEEQDEGTYGYYVVTGSTFHCVSELIRYNITEASDENRRIFGFTGMVMPVEQMERGLTGIQDDRYMTRLEPLSTAVFNLLKNCGTHYYEVRITIDDDPDNPDSYNPRMESCEDKPVVVISEDKYNIRRYSKSDSVSAYKNAIYAVTGQPEDGSAIVQLVPRDDGISGISRKEVAVDITVDSVDEIERYALKAAADYTEGSDFEIEPLFFEGETAPILAQKVVIKADGVLCETVITEIEDEYTAQGHTVKYVTGEKKLKVLNHLNKQIQSNSQKLLDEKIAGSGLKINNAFFVNEKTLPYFRHQYTVEYIRGTKTMYEPVGNLIYVQGYAFYKSYATLVAACADAMPYQEAEFKNVLKCGNNTDITSDVTFHVITTLHNTDGSGKVRQSALYSAGSNINAYEHTLGAADVQVSSLSKAGFAFLVTGYVAPSSTGDYGSVTGKVYVRMANNGVLAESNGYILNVKFASQAEYNAAVGLIYAPAPEQGDIHEIVIPDEYARGGEMIWRGYVDYYSGLAAKVPAEGDAYTVRYLGGSGNTEDGTVYLFGKDPETQLYGWVPLARGVHARTVLTRPPTGEYNVMYLLPNPAGGCYCDMWLNESWHRLTADITAHTHKLEELGAAPADHTHTAAQVGAAPAEHTHNYAPVNHTHTPSDIGAAPADHTHTAAQVGAAPADHTHTPEVIGAAAAENLLQNRYFADPINQRGSTTYTGAVYGIDRWIGVNAETTVTVNDGYVSVQAGKADRGICQKFDNRYLAGKTVTFSLLTYEGELLSATGAFPAGFSTFRDPHAPLNGQWDVYFANRESLPGVSVMLLSRSANVTLNIVAVKLELGDTQTLARFENGGWVLNDPPPDKAAELVKCRKYYCKLTRHPLIGIGYDSGKSILCSLPELEPMRYSPVTPTVTKTGNMTAFYGGVNKGTVKIDEFNTTNLRLKFSFNSTGSTVTDYDDCVLVFNTTGSCYIEFKAEL